MDLNAVTSSFRFLDWKNSFWVVPITITMTSDKDMAFGYKTALNAALVFALKSNNLHIVDSLTVVCGNQQLVSRQERQHIPATFRLLTEWNDNDVQSLGPSLGFHGADQTYYTRKMTTDAISTDHVEPEKDPTYVRRASSTFVVPTSVADDDWNIPLPISVDGSAGAAGTDTVLSVTGSAFQTLSQLETAPHLKFVDGVNTLQAATKSNVLLAKTRTLTLEMNCIIPMAYLHDLFDKMPLVRGALWQLTLNLHFPFTYNQTLTRPIVTAPTIYRTPFRPKAAPSITTKGGYIPFQLSGQALNNLFTDGATAALDVALSFQGDIKNTNMTASTLYCAMYDLEPGPGSTYLNNPVKTVVFRDHLVYNPAGAQKIGPNTAVQVNVTPGLSKLRRMIIVTEVADNNRGTPNGQGVYPYTGFFASAGQLSPFGSQGSTVAPYATLLDFNVAIAGKRLFDQNINYSFEHFLMNILGHGSPSGNGVDGLRTGLINERNWRENYGFVVIDLTRHAESSDGMPMPVDVMFKNGNTYTANYMFILEYEKEFKIDVLSGRIMIYSEREAATQRRWARDMLSLGVLLWC
jgi:hypothetical protein